jgi:hypothetical protein
MNIGEINARNASKPWFRRAHSVSMKLIFPHSALNGTPTPARCSQRPRGVGVDGHLLARLGAHLGELHEVELHGRRRSLFAARFRRQKS